MKYGSFREEKHIVRSKLVLIDKDIHANTDKSLEVVEDA